MRKKQRTFRNKKYKKRKTQKHTKRKIKRKNINKKTFKKKQRGGSSSSPPSDTTTDLDARVIAAKAKEVEAAQKLEEARRVSEAERRKLEKEIKLSIESEKLKKKAVAESKEAEAAQKLEEARVVLNKAEKEEEKAGKETQKISEELKEYTYRSWLIKRDKFLRDPCPHTPPPSPFIRDKGCMYIESTTNIDIITRLLEEEAMEGSNIYLCMDLAHSRLMDEGYTILNNNLNLLLFYSRGSESFTNPNFETKLFPTHYLYAMKENLDDDGSENLFDDEGCMTQNGFIFLITICLFIPYIFYDIERLIAKSKKTRETYTMGDLIYFIEALSPAQFPGYREIYELLLFTMLKLYKSNENVNDMLFEAGKAEKELYPGQKYGINILYTNKKGKNRFVHLPLPRKNDYIFLSDVMEYLKPLEKLCSEEDEDSFNFYLMHNSCRVDREFQKYPPSETEKESSLTRGISREKEKVDKKCFIKNFIEEDKQIEVEGYLKTFDSMFDYYRYLKLSMSEEDYQKAVIEILRENKPFIYGIISKNNPEQEPEPEPSL